MDKEHVFTTQLVTNLASSFNERLALDIADGAADFGDDDIWPRLLVGLEAHPSLDFIGDVRNDLNRVSEVLAPSLFANDFLINLASRDIRCSREVDIQEAFVVTDIKICFCPIIGDENLTMLERVHGSRIHVEVWIELLHHNAKAPTRQQIPERGGGKTFTQRGDNTPGHKNVFRDVRFGLF